MDEDNEKESNAEGCEERHSYLRDFEHEQRGSYLDDWEDAPTPGDTLRRVLDVIFVCAFVLFCVTGIYLGLTVLARNT